MVSTGMPCPRKKMPGCLGWVVEWEWEWWGIWNCLMGKMGMGFKYQMEMGMGWESEWSHWNGRDLVRKFCSRTSLDRRRYCRSSKIRAWFGQLRWLGYVYLDYFIPFTPNAGFSWSIIYIAWKAQEQEQKKFSDELGSAHSASLSYSLTVVSLFKSTTGDEYETDKRYKSIAGEYFFSQFNNGVYTYNNKGGTCFSGGEGLSWVAFVPG